MRLFFFSKLASLCKSKTMRIFVGKRTWLSNEPDPTSPSSKYYRLLANLSDNDLEISECMDVYLRRDFSNNRSL